MDERPATYDDIGVTCPVCFQALIEMTAHGDCEYSYECENAHWFYGQNPVCDGQLMFPGASRQEIIHGLNEAVCSSKQHKQRALLAPRWLHGWLLRWLTNEEAEQLLLSIDIRRLNRLSLLALEGWN